jgi:predicted nucleotide-binding protein (sugar kinase/HSP70/actin superfamily)
MDRPAVNFNDEGLLKKTCETYLGQFNIDRGVIHRAFRAAIRAQNEIKDRIRKKAFELIRRAETDHSLLIVLAGRPYHCDSLINHKIPDILTGFGADIITEDALVPLAQDLEDVQVVTQWSYPNRIYAAAKWVARKPDNIQLVQLNSFGCGPDAVVIDEVREILGTGGKNHTLIKVDEVTSPGSVRLRLRSMLESLKGKRTKQVKSVVPRKPFIGFGREDRKRTIWAPFFSEDYSAYLPAVFQNAGYQLKVLPRPDRKSVDMGLQYANNDICYPGIIVIGDIIKALKTRLHHPDDIAIGITQTGGQCRASNYLPLIRKALIRAGFEEIPIISVTASQGLIDQSGFQINWLFRMKILFVGTMFADCIAKMYYATAPREKTRGQAQTLRRLYMEKIGPCIVRADYSGIFKLLENAVDDFNGISVHERDLPRMGVVGEIYAKYNYFANQDLVHWLIRQGIEPVLPPIVDYFIQDLVNFKENIRAGIRRRKVSDLLGLPVEWLIRTNHERINDLFSRFKHGLPFEDIREVAQKASGVLSMTHQFGEGWLIPGEILTLAGQGIHDVVSLQPFGCIANHIVSKGMEKKIRKVCPEMNVYYLDFDAGMSEANIRNRLHFMVEHMV